MGALKRVVAKRGSQLYDDAGDTVSGYWSDLAGRVGPSLVGLGKQARSAQRVAFDHPAVIATVGLVVVGLVASLFFRSRAATPPTRSTRRRAEPAPSRAAETRRKRGRNQNANAAAH